MFLLASTSSYRRTLLARLGVAFEVVRPQINEDHVPGEDARTRARRLSLAKAHAVAERFPQAVVVGSDQVAEVGGLILDKPGNAENCRAQLAALSGKTAEFYTGCAVVRPNPERDLFYLDTTAVVFRTLDDAEIARYVALEQPFDCAGGFKAEALGISLFERIESQDPTALIGLPLIWLAGALRSAGLQVP